MLRRMQVHIEELELRVSQSCAVTPAALLPLGSCLSILMSETLYEIGRSDLRLYRLACYATQIPC